MKRYITYLIFFVLFSLAAFVSCRGESGNGNGNGNGGPGAAPPATPQNFRVEASAPSPGQITLNWDTKTGVTYNLFFSTNTGFTLENGTKMSDVTPPHAHTGLMDNTTYYYRLTAVNSSGASEPTEEIPATTLPAAPQGFQAFAWSQRVTLTWTREEGVTYDLFHSTEAGFDLESGAKISRVTSPHVHGSLTNNTTYYYRLTANNAAGASAPTAEVSATPQVQQISAGIQHACALVNGHALCWGTQKSGRLGNGEDKGGAEIGGMDMLTPVQVIGLTSGVTQIAAGGSHACAVVNGGAWCWGWGAKGQLGHNETPDANANKSTPTQVIGLTSGVTQISAGAAHTCAVVDGGAKCWGEGENGRLGHNKDDGNTDFPFPTYVYNLTSGVTQISAGDSHTCALVNGGVWCWGKGGNGRLGHNETEPNEDKSIPTPVAGLTSGVTQISAGADHTCALVNGGAKCWGWGILGQLGTSKEGHSYTENAPVYVIGLTTGVTQISAGAQYTCAVVGGRAECWGADNSGKLGNGESSSNLTPGQVVDLTSGVTQISAGQNHTCAVANGQALCWGQGKHGRLGHNSTDASEVPVAVDFSN